LATASSKEKHGELGAGVEAFLKHVLEHPRQCVEAFGAEAEIGGVVRLVADDRTRAGRRGQERLEASSKGAPPEGAGRTGHEHASPRPGVGSQ
jgi:hypothetical protein